MEWFIKCIKQYADFKGRARRKEYWMFTLFYLIFGIEVMFIDLMIFEGELVFSTLYGVFIFIPSLAVAVRRLHDIGNSAWWLLFGLIPFAGLLLLVLVCLDSEPGTNKWGDNPKELNN